MADLTTANSTYATGTNDTATTLVNNVSTTDAQQYNGVASAVVQIETVLGVATSLKGSTTDLVTRLAVALTSTGSLVAFPSGTVMLFAQTAAPTGWTKLTTHNDKALRVVSGAAGSGGAVAFTTAFAAGTLTFTSDGTAITIAQMPGHTHGINPAAGVSGVSSGTKDQFTAPTGTNTMGIDIVTNSTGGGGTHTHAIAGPSLAVQYVDVILAQKD